MYSQAMGLRRIAKERQRQADARGRAAGYDRLSYETALQVCAATTPAVMLAELGRPGMSAEDAATAYAEGTVERFRSEAYEGALEGFRRSAQRHGPAHR